MRTRLSYHHKKEHLYTLTILIKHLEERSKFDESGKSRVLTFSENLIKKVAHCLPGATVSFSVILGTG